MEQSNINTLMQIGLSEKEARVYMAALTKGASSILQLSQMTGIKRSTVYTVVDSLINRSLMHSETSGVKTLFFPENPEKLQSILETQQTLLNNKMPELLATFMQLKGSDSFIKHYNGLSGVKTVYRQLLNELKPMDDYLVISDRAKWFNMDKKFFDQFLRRRANMKLNTKVLLQDTKEAKTHLNKQKEYNINVKVLPTSLLLDTSMVIVPHKVIITQTIAPLLSIVIENKSVVQTHKAIFETLWQLIN